MYILDTMMVLFNVYTGYHDGFIQSKYNGHPDGFIQSANSSTIRYNIPLGGLLISQQSDIFR